MAGVEESQKAERLPMIQDGRGLSIEPRQAEHSRGGHRATESSQPHGESAESSRRAASWEQAASRRGSQTWRERAGAGLVGFGEYGNLPYSDAYWIIQYMRPMSNNVEFLKTRKGGR